MGRKRRSPPEAILRVVIADDHVLLPEAVRALLEPYADIEVAGVTHEADRIPALVAELEPDVLLLDAHMPGTDGLAFLDRLRASHPAVAVVLLAKAHDQGLTTAALERGAKGVILKGSDPNALAPALRAAIRGHRDAGILGQRSIARSAAKFHPRHVYAQLGVARRLEALRVLVDRAIFGKDYDWL